MKHFGWTHFQVCWHAVQRTVAVAEFISFCLLANNIPVLQYIIQIVEIYLVTSAGTKKKMKHLL